MSQAAGLDRNAFGEIERPHEPSLPARALRAFWRFCRRKKVGAASLFLAFFILLTGVFGPYVMPYTKDEVFQIENPNYDPDSFDADALSPTILQRLDGPSWDHPFGTDQLGRDLLTRIVHGARRAMQFGFGSAALATFLGALLGVVSGYFGGILDLVIQRLVDAMIAIPGLLFLLLLVQTGETTVPRTIVALSFLGAFGVSRVVRAATLSVRNDVYIDAARVVGARPLRIIFRHVLPNVAAPIIVIFSTTIGTAILAESGLAFLNLAPPGASWGQMVSQGRQIFDVSPWLSIFSGGAITLTVLSFNLFGDALRDVLDPRLRGS